MSKQSSINKSIILSLVPYLVILIIIVGANYFKLKTYATPELSFITHDTPTYIKASELDVTTMEFFTSIRPASIAAFYKLFTPTSGYQIPEIQSPFTNSQNIKMYQPGFDRITITQSIISTIAWSFLAMTFGHYIRNPFMKIIGATTIITFSVVPQLSDWDNILQSESLSFSFFALTLAFLILWTSRITKMPFNKDPINIALTLFLAVVFLFWITIRDINAYFLVGLIFWIIFSIAFPTIRKKLPIKLILSSILIFSTFFFLQNFSFSHSIRWVKPLVNNIKVVILPSEKRVNIFESYGMPISEEILSYKNDLGNREYKNNQEFMQWIVQDGVESYKKFLLSTPFHTLFYPLSFLDEAFETNSQVYFINRDVPDWLVKIGDFLHPTNADILVFNLIFLGILILKAISNPKIENLSLFWVLILISLNSVILYYVSMLGDSMGVLRHALSATLLWRLLPWLLLVLIVDNELFQAKMRWKNRLID